MVLHIKMSQEHNSFTVKSLWNELEYSKNVTRFVKTQHDAFLKIQIFTSVSYMYLKLCSVAIINAVMQIIDELQG